MVRVHEGPPSTDSPGIPRKWTQWTPKKEPTRGVLTPGSLVGAVGAFLLSRSVGGCTSRTVQLYCEVLTPFVHVVSQDAPSSIEYQLSGCTTLAVQAYLSRLRERVNPTTAHLHFSKLRATTEHDGPAGKTRRGKAATRRTRRHLGWQRRGQMKGCAHPRKIRVKRPLAQVVRAHP